MKQIITKLLLLTLFSFSSLWAQDGTELLKNNDFDNDTNDWSLVADDGAEVTFDINTESLLIGENSAHITINSYGSGNYNWEIGLNQSIPGGVEAGKKYHIEYQIRASATCSIENWVQQSHDPWDPIYQTVTDVTTEAQTFIDTFVVSETDDPCQWSFALGAVGVDSIEIWIDGVHFIELGSGDVEPEANLVGHWNFNDTLNVVKAEVGNDLVINGGHQVVAGPSENNHAISIASGSNCLLNHGLSKGGTVDSYTLIFDVKIPDISGYQSLYQTALDNNTDATVFINSSGNVGLGATGYTDAALESGQWYRIAVAYKINERIDYYIDGVKELEGNYSDSYVSQIFPLDSAGVLLFADNDGEDGLIVVSDVKLYDGALGDDKIGELGGISSSSLVGHWNFNDTLNVVKAEVGSDLVINGGYQVVAGPSIDDNAISIASGSNCLLNHGLSKGGTVDSYTLIFDVKIPDISGYQSLYQTALDNNTDATVFINSSGNVGLGATGYTDAALESGQWYRIAVAYKINERIDYYIDGVKELEGNYSDSYVSQIFPLDSAGVLLFADNDGEDGLIVVSDVKLYNEALGDDEIGELGGVEETSDELPLPEGGIELLANNYFNNGMDKWNFSAQGNAEATASIDSTEALDGENSSKVSITKQGDGQYNWEIEMSQSLPGGVKAGKMYHIQYQAKASKEATLETWIQQWHDNFDPIYASEMILTTEVQTFVDTFYVSESDSQVVFAFAYGAMGVDLDVWVDAVHVIEFAATDINDNENMVVKEFALEQNYPNPFNPSTEINFAMPKSADVKLSVYNILGEKVAELINGKMVAGNHSVNFNATNLASGMYLYRLEAGSFVSVKKMMLLK